VLGVGIGIASASVPSYLSELAPAKQRGTIATLFQFMIVTGLCLAYVIDYFFLPLKNILYKAGQSGYFANWQLMLGFAAIPAIILLFGAIMVPESPRFLVKVGQTDRAREILMTLRKGDSAQVDAELSEIETVAHEPVGGLKDLVTVARPALIASCGIAILQQFVGINAALYYGPKIAAGVMPSSAPAGSIAALMHDQSLAILFGVVNILATVVTLFIMNKFKNKKLLYAGAAIMCVFSFVLVAVKLSNGAIPGIVGIISVCIYIVGFAFSWGPIVWNTIGEIFPLAIRGIGASVATFANWAANGLIMTIFPIIIQEKANGSSHVEYAFILYGICCVIAILFVRFFVPETKGMSLEQIEEQMRGHKNAK
jgi:sugar porter (SP) family MFS transporter